MEFTNFITSLLTSLIPPNFKLDCLESKNSYILLINAVSFKLCLINFVYFFETPGSVHLSSFIVNIFLTITVSDTIQTVLDQKRFDFFVVFTMILSGVEFEQTLITLLSEFVQNSDQT